MAPINESTNYSDTRTAKLLAKVADEFDRGTDPLYNSEWLVENEVSFDEIQALGSSIAMAIRVYATVMDIGLSEGFYDRKLAALILTDTYRKMETE